MYARLKVLQQKSHVKPIKLQPSTVVGRSAECDLRITSGLVSRVHCRITVNDESVLVEDLGSANGTFVDGESLNPHQPKLVNPGSKLVIGPVEFIVEYATSTSNTIVIRRSTDGTRPGLEELKQASSLSDGELLLASSGLAFDDDLPMPAQPKSRPAAVSPKPAEPVRPAAQAPVAPKPSAPVRPATERLVADVRTPEVTPPRPVAKPAVQPADAAPPVAKVVTTPATPTDDAPLPRRSEPVVIQPSPPSKQAPPAPAKRVPVAAPAPIAPVPQVIEFAEAAQPIAAEEQTIQFQFGDATDDAPSAKSIGKADKNKSMKSLFSMFGGKQKPEKSNPVEPEPAAVPTEPVAVSPEPVVKDDAQNLVFGGPESSEEESSTEDNSQMDDDFQNFLRQF